MTLTMEAQPQMEEGQQLVVPMVMDADLWQVQLAHKPKEECAHKIISIKAKILLMEN